jgi:hypothetical protein
VGQRKNEDLETLLSLIGDSADALIGRRILRAEAFDAAGDVEQAASLVDDGLAETPDCLALLTCKASILSRSTERRAQAGELVRQILAREPLCPRTHRIRRALQSSTTAGFLVPRFSPLSRRISTALGPLPEGC